LIIIGQKKFNGAQALFLISCISSSQGEHTIKENQREAKLARGRHGDSPLESDSVDLSYINKSPPPRLGDKGGRLPISLSLRAEGEESLSEFASATPRNR